MYVKRKIKLLIRINRSTYYSIEKLAGLSVLLYPIKYISYKYIVHQTSARQMKNEGKENNHEQANPESDKSSNT